MHYFSTLFWQRNLHVWDRLAVHHSDLASRQSTNNQLLWIHY